MIHQAAGTQTPTKQQTDTLVSVLIGNMSACMPPILFPQPMAAWHVALRSTSLLYCVETVFSQSQSTWTVPEFPGCFLIATFSCLYCQRDFRVGFSLGLRNSLCDRQSRCDFCLVTSPGFQLREWDVICCQGTSDNRGKSEFELR